MTTEEKIEIIRAFDEGKEVEFYVNVDEGWCKKTRGVWDFEHTKYRIKPQPTRLEVANDFFEKTFGISGKFTKHSCLANNCEDCPLKGQHPCCDVESWWNAPYEEPEIEK